MPIKHFNTTEYDSVLFSTKHSSITSANRNYLKAILLISLSNFMHTVLNLCKFPLDYYPATV